MIGSEIQHFKITAKLGEGGMGEVFVATDTRLDRQVALKFLPPHYSQDPELKARFEHEAKAAAALNHPNIITVYELGEHQGRNFIAMELIEGETLEEKIESGDLNLAGAVDIAGQVCAGLGSAHKAGIVHRDIKPANIFVGKDGEVKILDFGLAKSRRATTETKAGTTVGTVQYESPEQSRGENVDQRSDLFSLGVLLYEMVTAQRPFRGEFEDAIRYAIANELPEPMVRYKSDVSDDLQRIVSKLLEKDPEARYQTAAGVTSDLILLKRASGPHASSVHQVASSAVPPAAQPKRRLLPILVPSGIALIAIALALVFRPWNTVLEPMQEAVAGEDRLAVMYFDNLPDPTDENRLGEMVANLLITSLSQSQSIKVLSSQRLFDLLHQLGHDGSRSLDRVLATRVAKKANAQWILTGTILQTEPEVVITAQIVDVATGQVELSRRSEALPGEKIFAQIDRLSAELRTDLDLPAPTDAAAIRILSETTTRSEEAYRLYLEALEDRRMMFDERAREKFKQVVALDSTFAMAWFWLASIWPTNVDASDWARSALKFSYKVSESDRYHIAALSEYIAGDFDAAIANLEQVITLDPENKSAYVDIAGIYRENKHDIATAIKYLNEVLSLDPAADYVLNTLAYANKDLRQYDRALDAINKYIAVVPDEPNPYDSRGEILLAAGRFDEAIASYHKALSVAPDFPGSLAPLVVAYLFKGNRQSADSCVQAMTKHASPLVRSIGRFDAALALMSAGKLKAALEIVDQGMGADRLEDMTGFFHSLKIILKAELYYSLGLATEAVSAAEELVQHNKAADPNDPDNFMTIQARMLASVGQADRAEQLLHAIEAGVLASGNPTSIGAFWRAMGTVHLARGDWHLAVSTLKQSISADPRVLRPMGERLLARAYLELNQPDSAISLLKRQVSAIESFRSWFPVHLVDAHLMLGRAYAEVGEADHAAENFKFVLEYFKDADDGLASVKEARRRLAELQS